MKLSQNKIRKIVSQKRKGASSIVLARTYHITRRRIDQIWKYYQDHGENLPIGQNLGRPRKPFTDDESKIIEEAFRKYKFGARMLEVIIRVGYKKHISHNRIHQYLKDHGYARSESAKQRQRKWVRYERKHSMSAIHIDWHEVPLTDVKVCAVLDDSSRKILAAGEFENINTENSIVVMERALHEYASICRIREIIMDHGSEFGAHRRDENGYWDSEFKQYLESKEIQPILARVKHPQTNGKIEKWFHAYVRFRNEFVTLDEFIDWYNDRPHGSLDFEHLESPNIAFWNRLPKAAILGNGFRIFGW
jgi:putative transposase